MFYKLQSIVEIDRIYIIENVIIKTKDDIM